jgi:glycerol-3-phosphate acyltransferase PlsY
VTILAIVAGFLIGSIPVGYVIGRAIFRVDIRASGSGNIGTVNSLRTFGAAGGVAVLLLDLAKGFIPTILTLHFLDTESALAVAFAAILGHCFSPWLGFRGGKGVATAVGALIALSWPAALAAGLAWVVVAFATRYASVASMIACGVGAAAFAALSHDRLVVPFGVALTAFIIWTHRENIARLRSGTENAISLGGARVSR